MSHEIAAIDAPRAPVAARRWPETLRWGICLALALGMHAAAAAALARWGEPPDQVAEAPVIMIELATLPVAPDNKPSNVAPGPPQPQAEVQPQQQEPAKPLQQTVALPPAPQAEPLEAVPPLVKPADKPVEKKTRHRHASLASAPSTAARRAEHAAAPAAGAASHNPEAVPNWKSQLVARLERFKRYPAAAEQRGEQGVAQLAFSVDRGGGVHHARIVRGSGSSLLDEATLALIERAAPLPPPPPEIAGTQIAITVPIRYSIR